MGCTVAGHLMGHQLRTTVATSDFGQEERSLCNKLPDLCDMLNQARGARAAGHVPVQSVAPMQLPFASVRDLDCQCQWCHDQTLAK